MSGLSSWGGDSVNRRETSCSSASAGDLKKASIFATTPVHDIVQPVSQLFKDAYHFHFISCVPHYGRYQSSLPLCHLEVVCATTISLRKADEEKGWRYFGRHDDSSAFHPNGKPDQLLAGRTPTMVRKSLVNRPIISKGAYAFLEDHDGACNFTPTNVIISIILLLSPISQISGTPGRANDFIIGGRIPMLQRKVTKKLPYVTFFHGALQGKFTEIHHM